MEDKRQEDVEAGYLLNTIRSAISYVFNSIIKLVGYSIKNVKTLVVFMLITTSACIGVFLTSKPYYESHLTISHTRLNNDYCIEMINHLNALTIDNKGKENVLLAQKLGISTDLAKKIKAIRYRAANDDIARVYNDSTIVILPFKVVVKVYDNSILPVLEKSILSYLESNEYSKIRKELEKQSLLRIEERLNVEIANLDSLKRLVDKGIVPQSTGNGIILGQPINPIVIYEASMRLYEEKVQISTKLSLNNSFEVLIPFSENNKSNKGPLIYAAIGIAVGYIFGLIFLVLRKKVKALN